MPIFRHSKLYHKLHKKATFSTFFYGFFADKNRQIKIPPPAEEIPSVAAIFMIQQYRTICSSHSAAKWIG